MGRIVEDAHVLLELGLSGTVTAEEEAIVQQAVVKAEGAVKRFLMYDPLQASRTEYYPGRDMDPSFREAIWEATDTEAVLRRRSTASTDELQLLHIPVRSYPTIDLRVEYDGRFGTKVGAFGASSQKVEGVDFWPDYELQDSGGYKVCPSGVLRSIGRWPSEPGSVKVTYTAGYSRAELEGQDSLIDASPIMDAVIEEALRRAKKALVLWRKNSTSGHLAGTITSESLGDYSYSVNPGVLDKLIGGASLTSESKEKLSSFVHYGLVM